MHKVVLSNVYNLQCFFSFSGLLRPQSSARGYSPGLGTSIPQFPSKIGPPGQTQRRPSSSDGDIATAVPYHCIEWEDHLITPYTDIIAACTYLRVSFGRLE